MSKILVIAPHADDEVLGVGGTMARMSAEGHDVHVAVLTGHGPGSHPLGKPEKWAVVRNEAKKAHQILGVSKTHFLNLSAVLVPDMPVYQVNETVLNLISVVNPTLLFVPFLFDMHLDHRAITYACSVAWRPSSPTGRDIREIYMYETLSETHWNIQPQEAGFFPNTFIDISGVHLKKKLEALKCFKSQMRPFPDCRSLQTIESLARWRGSLVGLCASESFILVRRIL